VPYGAVGSKPTRVIRHSVSLVGELTQMISETKTALLAQSVEHKTFMVVKQRIQCNLGVTGSSPVGGYSKDIDSNSNHFI
jgi:hypothetical protein